MARLCLLLTLLVLQCIWFSWCSATVKNPTNCTKVELFYNKVESFKRQSKDNRFLKAEWIHHKKGFNLFFTGNENKTGTTFIFKKCSKRINGSPVSMFYTIHPATRPTYFLSVDGRSLVVKNSTMDPMTNDNNVFWLKRVDLTYVEKYEVLHVIGSKATGHVITSKKHGKALMGLNWKDCGAWMAINEKGN